MKQEDEVKSNQKGNDQYELHKYGFGESEMGSGSRLYSLLASKNRDFLLSPTGTPVKISDLQGKIVGIYFSANWYPPCRKFTPVLVNAYEQLRNCDPGFEVVFVSSDEDHDAFDDYRALMPWLAIPFSDLDSKKALNRRFDVEGIPFLIILQPNDDTEDSMVLDGVDLIYRYGTQAYPFTKERLEELLRDEKDKHENQTLLDLLTNHERDFLIGHKLPKQVPVTSLIRKTVGLYFSAQWCFPGVKFTPKLASIYQKINQELTANGPPEFEIVYVSSDHDQTSFDSHFQTMPWLAIPYGDPNIKNLAKYFDIRGIPSLVILGPDGKTVTKQGRNLVNLYQEHAYPFTQDKIEFLERQINEEAKNLPKSKFHSGHHHELTLVSEGNGGGPFICCDCDEQGSGWAYLCIDCGYEVHPKCVKTVDHGSATGT
ncbi:Thioredoxin, nucleoredoxin [Handroanthus impetiginosus]|uniref:protein-disulfide reductase n=1 Tax=Handroanthus impetiginosus TaxID=429701 RepID=A0A2G9HYT7_9LAMI|nr:Thioredoxin, nucleoredoxin [Handroanthus impetiginosus]